MAACRKTFRRIVDSRALQNLQQAIKVKGIVMSIKGRMDVNCGQGASGYCPRRNATVGAPPSSRLGSF